MVGGRRLTALLDEYGDETVTEALVELRARAAKLMRASIAELPDGTYACDDWLDNDGITDVPLKIALDVTIAGDRMTLDFSVRAGNPWTPPSTRREAPRSPRSCWRRGTTSRLSAGWT